MLTPRVFFQGIRDSYRENPGVTTLVGATLGVSWLFSAGAILRWLISAEIMHTWPGPQYLFNYNNGFVRRGLPGEILRLLGLQESNAAIRILALLVTLLGICSILIIASHVAQRISDPVMTFGVFVVISASPFTIAMFARDIGRFDAFGAIALAVALIGAQYGQNYQWLAIWISSISLAIAVASSEFFIVLLPLVFFICWPLLSINFKLARKSLLKPLLEILILGFPSIVVAILSFTTQPASTWVHEIELQAGLSNHGLNPVSALTQSFTQATDLVLAHRNDALITTAAYFTIAAISIWSVTRIAEIRSKTWNFWVLYSCAFALALSLIGIDYRRWWTLAFITVCSAAVIVKQRVQSRRIPSWNRKTLSLLVIVLLITVLAQNIPGTFVEKGYLFHVYHALIGFF